MASTAPTSSGTAPATAPATAAPKQANAATVADRDDDEDRASGTGLGVPMHAIHKGRLFLGNLRAARDKSLLQEHGITHVLSVVPAKAPFPKDFVYCLVPFEDEPGASLFANLRACIDFMTTTLAKDDTKLLVHCQQGVSRSASMTIAYLMVTERMAFHDALVYVRKSRSAVRPNEGFMHQLEAFDGMCSRLLPDVEALMAEVESEGAAQTSKEAILASEVALARRLLKARVPRGAIRNRLTYMGVSPDEVFGIIEGKPVAAAGGAGGGGGAAKGSGVGAAAGAAAAEKAKDLKRQAQVQAATK